MLDTILIKTASRCNLDCTYCYVYRGADTSWQDQPYRMNDATIEKVVERITEYSLLQETGFAIVLHGGEPLLLGERRLESLLSGLRRVLNPQKYPISIQTNGVLITEKILNLCSKYRVSISVSIDGTRKANDIARFTRGGNSSFEDVINGIKKLSSHQDHAFLFAGTLSVIQPNIPAEDTYHYLKSINSPSIDFLFQDGNYDRMPYGKKDLQTTEYGEWLAKVFELYMEDSNPVPIKILDDILKIYLGGSPIKEGKGNNAFGILIIESDGEIRKNDTLRASFEGVDFFKGRPSVHNTSLMDVVESEEYIIYTKSSSPLSAECQLCEYKDVCGGGMPLYRWSKTKGFDNPSIYCADHKIVISTVKKFLQRSKLL
ncbi:TPA: radical SAM protein [Escherichia coli]|nr:radical SAM protein [Escherichia coli]